MFQQYHGPFFDRPDRIGGGTVNPYSATPSSLDVPPVHNDEIEQAKQRFVADPNPDKVGLHVGVFQNFRAMSTQLAIDRAVEQIKRDAYLASSGDNEFVSTLQNFAFGDLLRGYDTARFMRGFQTEGGTHGNFIAMGIAIEGLKAEGKAAHIHVPNQTWAAHHSIIKLLGGNAQEYFYVDPQTQLRDFNRTHDNLAALPEGSFVLLHTCCQNPTGLDFSRSEWKEVVELAQRRNLRLILDSAYLGLGHGLMPALDLNGNLAASPEGNPNLVWDNEPLSMCIDRGVFAFVPVGTSKTHNLYNKRVGALYIFSPQAGEIQNKAVEYMRPVMGSPNSVGAIIFKIIENDPELRSLNRDENQQKIQLMKSNRALLGELLQAENLQCSFSHLAQGIGMFSLLPLSPLETVAMAERFAIHIPDTGRINLAALNADNVQRVVAAISSIIRERCCVGSI